MQSSTPSLASPTQLSACRRSTATSQIDMGNEKTSKESTFSRSQSADSTDDPHFYRSAAPSPSPPPSDFRTQLPPLDHSRKRPADFDSPPASADSLLAFGPDSKRSQLGENSTTASTGAGTVHRNTRPTEMGYIKWAKGERPKHPPLPQYCPPETQRTAVSTTRPASDRIPKYDGVSGQWK